ncbi:N-acetylglucosamine-6-phosphate deacetylase [Macrococcus equipercicus]|uniref:N-acetylglucosamine-6-phosphate deacetylase n=1 Tax=Macrococcus equipercicus TaxID=69967 RepID=A0ABQ6R7W8_9STAP|nr:N-acetylglucosamine-6-phosphate deacetylase [Macrococcus equipercicus]KAA1039186.1 N-acetylglucosamine-6-phosphate deacetylase [Macrococcus equipercicus]
MQVINNVKIYTEHAVIERGYVLIDGERIAAVEPGDYAGDCTDVMDGGGHILLPGFIDIHIHGGYGVDTMDADKDALTTLTEGLLSEGTTSFLATTMTEDLSRVKRALDAASAYDGPGAEIIGIHVEGPFISEHKVGAQNPDYVRRPTVELIEELQRSARGKIKIMTIAPEVEGAMDVIREKHEDIIFSLGHTVATFDELNEAAAAGAAHITHLYNAATPFEHREPGAFGAAWLNDGLKTECIVDGVHSHPAAVKIAYRLKGRDRFMVITDAMRAKGMPDGDYELGGQRVIKKGGKAVLASGTLAGSILKMNDALRNFMAYTGETLDNAWRVVSYNQAVALGMQQDIGSIKAGKYADLVLVDHELNVLTAVKKGYMKFIKN